MPRLAPRWLTVAASKRSKEFLSRCHGLAPWYVTFAASKGSKGISFLMPWRKAMASGAKKCLGVDSEQQILRKNVRTWETVPVQDLALPFYKHCLLLNQPFTGRTNRT